MMISSLKKCDFRNFMEAAPEDFPLLAEAEKQYERNHMVPRILAELKSLDDADSPYPINRFQHSLQTATRAVRDHADEELVVAALLHDVGDNLAMRNHAQISAAILQPYVSKKTHWIVEQHAIFQGYYFWHHLGDDRHARDAFKDHPWYDDCAYFCEHYDQASFDRDYDTLPLEHFEPMVRRIFARQPFGAHGDAAAA